MRHAVVAFVALLLSAPGIASAKANTLRIEITGPSLSRPLQITSPEIVQSFHIWNGPGVTVNGEPVHLDRAHQHGHFIDWPRGIANDRAAGMQRFTVTFHLDAKRAPSESSLRYVVFYEFEPSKTGGYIYLPLPKDTSPHSNTAIIVHGVEGNWFFSTTAWEQHIRAAITTQQRLTATASAR
jgi:hypothetical protein